MFLSFLNLLYFLSALQKEPGRPKFLCEIWKTILQEPRKRLKEKFRQVKLAVLYSMYTLFISTSIPFLVYKSGHLHIYCSTITIGDVNIKAVLSFHFVNNISYIDYLNTYCKLSFNMKKTFKLPPFSDNKRCRPCKICKSPPKQVSFSLCLPE